MLTFLAGLSLWLGLTEAGRLKRLPAKVNGACGMREFYQHFQARIVRRVHEAFDFLYGLAYLFGPIPFLDGLIEMPQIDLSCCIFAFARE